MASRTITIERILEKESNKGEKYYVLRSNGDGYFLWSEELPEGVAEGSRVWIDFTAGKYPRITKIRPLNSSEALQQVSKRDEQVLRSVALNGQSSGERPPRCAVMSRLYFRQLRSSLIG